MKNKFVITFMLLVVPTIVFSEELSYEQHIKNYYKEVVKEIHKYGLKGPIAIELGQYAQLRCIHEDGKDRSPDISMNGMVPGSPNKEVIQRLNIGECKLGCVTAKDGQGCYVIKGPRANIIGATAIALWYDMMVNNDTFRICSAKEREIWNLSKHISREIDKGFIAYRCRFEELRKERCNIIRKVNRAYGPMGLEINRLRNKLLPVFEEVLK